jgi:hypothetical protein
MTAWLVRQGESADRKRVQRLLRAMGLEALYPKPVGQARMSSITFPATSVSRKSRPA